MLLEDATSKEQVQRALDAGDQELREDIEEKLDDAMRWWDAYGINEEVQPDEEEIDFKEFAVSDAFIDEVIAQSPRGYDLVNVPREEVAASLRWDATHQNRRRNRIYWGPFYVDDSGGGGFSYRLSTQLSAHFPVDELPENAEYIPPEMAHRFWDSLDGHFEWQERDSVEENWGTGEGEPIYITAESENFDEWCRDLLAQHMDFLISKDPAGAKETFLKALSYENGPLGEKMRSAELPEEEVLSFASQWFQGDEHRDEIIDTIKEYFATLETGHDEPREVIGEWTQADLRAMGITKGPLYEEAPWKLIKLHPADLRLEGALMRHCVGDQGMGYTKALKDGEIEIWSLRSRANKPRFTLEVDAGTFYEPGDVVGLELRETRAAAIKQLKGKANRTPGYADTRETGGIKFPDEVIFWVSVLSQLGAEPIDVADFTSLRSSPDSPLAESRRRMRANPGSTGFDLPYRPLR
jgi:hypothetical protein